MIPTSEDKKTHPGSSEVKCVFIIKDHPEKDKIRTQSKQDNRNRRSGPIANMADSQIHQSQSDNVKKNCDGTEHKRAWLQKSGEWKGEHTISGRPYGIVNKPSLDQSGNAMQM